MLRHYLPAWLKEERNEFVLEVASALTLLLAVIVWLA